MIRSGAITAIRTATAHDGDTQVTDTQLGVWIDLEVTRLRREVNSIAPGLYSDTTATQALTSSDPDFDLPADFERLIRFERLEGTRYVGVDVADELHPDLSCLRGARLEDGVIRVFPAEDAAGTYRLVYCTTHTLTSDYTLTVPGGCEDIIVERVSARVRVRLNEDPTPHQVEAARIWAEQKTAIRRRYGAHSTGGLVRTGGR